MHKPKITVEAELFVGYDEETLEERILCDVADKIVNQIGDETKKRMQKVADEMAAKRVAEAIEEAIREPWRQTNQWGEPNGKVTTLAEMVRQKLDESVQLDSYRDARKPRMSLLVQKAVEEVLKNELKSVIPEMQAQFKAAVDQEISAKLKKTLADALGLKIA